MVSGGWGKYVTEIGTGLSARKYMYAIRMLWTWTRAAIYICACMLCRLELSRVLQTRNQKEEEGRGKKKRSAPVDFLRFRHDPVAVSAAECVSVSPPLSHLDVQSL